ncbi:MAG: hypothetical protein ISN26_08075 [Betaproteobacteria bacterium AqS2]|uniref:Uncharacterized protein n=1 Tax=Candidatus Amphirhobacter heronislandensis TaxID=1732024 RepID=A0A930Y245_9GAMM|nr:hypothetical protein [Betaproteobacteria bacterium AqS2]
MKALREAAKAVWYWRGWIWVFVFAVLLGFFIFRREYWPGLWRWIKETAAEIWIPLAGIIG